MAFYGIEFRTRIPLIPNLGSIEAYRAYDASRPCIVVRPRPERIANHLAGESSTVPELDRDLIAMRDRRKPGRPGELAMLELRYVEQGRVPIGIFAPARGWQLRELGFIRCEVELGAAIALQIFRGYSHAVANAIAPEGELVREVLPFFDNVSEIEEPSFTGLEPEISVFGRIREARAMVAKLSEHELSVADGADTDDDAAALEAELVALANDVDLGPVLARVLATQYTMASPWR